MISVATSRSPGATASCVRSWSTPPSCGVWPTTSRPLGSWARWPTVRNAVAASRGGRARGEGRDGRGRAEAAAGAEGPVRRAQRDRRDPRCRRREEANLFARDLYEMYRAYASRLGWRFELMAASPSDLGGYSEVTFRVAGDSVWSRMKFEAGPHRVQRVPVTESQGRVHTSSATVAVLPEADEVEVRHRPERPGHRRVPLLGSRRSVGQHDRLRGAHHAPADRAGRVDAGREEPDPEPRQGDDGAARAPARARTGRRSDEPPARRRPRSVAAVAARRSAPTTSRRTGSRTTGSG